MGTCDEIFELLSAALDGELTPEEQTALDAHLAGCSACSALYEELRRLRAAMADLPELTAPEGFSARVMAAVSAEAAQKQADNVTPFPRKRHSAGVWKRWGACAAAVAVVALGALALPGLLPGSREMAAGDAQKAADAYSIAADTAEAADAAMESDLSDTVYEAYPDGESGDTNSAADHYGMKQEVRSDSSGSDNGLSYRAVLTISGDSAPDWLMEEYEFTQNGAVQSCILPAQELYALAQELELTLDELDPDAEYGLLLVTES